MSVIKDWQKYIESLLAGKKSDQPSSSTSVPTPSPGDDKPRRSVPKLWRHGDLLIQETNEIPPGAKKRPNLILMRGEITGHSHRISESEAAEVWEAAGLLYVRVVAPLATLVHDEHKPIELPMGLYKVWQQREYTPREIRQVRD